MREKIIALVLIASFSLLLSASAQEWPSAENIVAKIKTELNLTEEQFDKVKLIIEENMAERKAIMPQLEKGLTQAQSQPLDAQLYTKLTEVLTRTQMAKWDRIRELLLQDIPENQIGR